MLPIRGLYEVAIRVKDLSKSEAFYREILGLEVGIRDDRGRDKVDGGVHAAARIGQQHAAKPVLIALQSLLTFEHGGCPRGNHTARNHTADLSLGMGPDHGDDLLQPHKIPDIMRWPCFPALRPA